MNTAPGWYDDNTNPGGLRWFDGRDWTAYTAPAPSFAPPGQVGAPPSYAGQPMTPYGHPGQKMPYGYGYPPHPRSQEEGDGPGEVLHWIVPVGRSWQSIAAVGSFGVTARKRNSFSQLAGAPRTTTYDDHRSVVRRPRSVM